MMCQKLVVLLFAYSAIILVLFASRSGSLTIRFVSVFSLFPLRSPFPQGTVTRLMFLEHASGNIRVALRL
jgi:hypothetical protein